MTQFFELISLVLALLCAEVTKVHLPGGKINCLSLRSSCKPLEKAPSLQLQTQQGLSSWAAHNTTTAISRSIRNPLHVASSEGAISENSLRCSSKEGTALVCGLQTKTDVNKCEMHHNFWPSKALIRDSQLEKVWGLGFTFNPVFSVEEKQAHLRV